MEMDTSADDITLPLQIVSLNRHFIRLISCGDDYQFQEMIKTLLPAIIQSIELQSDDFKNKALEVFAHINKRIKSRSEIQIPTKNLLEIFVNLNASSPLSSNFSIMYIKMGFMRLKSDEQIELIPLLFQCILGRSTQNQELILGLIVHGIQHVKIIPNSNSNIVKYGLVDQPELRKLFLNFLLNVLLLSYKFEESKTRLGTTSSQRPPVEPSQDPVDEVLFSTMEDAPTKEVETFKQPFPCMNEQLHNRITQAIQTDDLNRVEKLKVGILKFLNGHIYSEDEILFHFVLASADPRYSVVLAAEHDIKRLTVAVDWNKMQHVQSLYEFFLGTAKTVRQQQTDESSLRNPSNIRIRLKLFPYLLKSKTASTIFTHAIQILYESLFGNSTNARIKYLSLQFAQNIIQNTEVNLLVGVSKLILNALEKVLNNETSKTHDASRLRSLAYVLIGKLSYRVPNLFADDIRLTQQFFEALKTEDNECCLNIQEALTLLAYSQKNASPSSKLILEQLLTEQVVPNPKSKENFSDFPHCRQAAVTYVMNVFPSNDCTSRFILLAACSDKNEDIRSLASRNLFNEQTNNYPEFDSLLRLILKNAHGNYPIGRQCLVYHPQTYQEMIYYLHRCLLQESFNGEKSTPMWKYEERISSIFNHVKIERNLWTNYMKFLLDFVSVIHDCLSTYFLFEAVLIGFQFSDCQILDWLRENLTSFRQLSLFSTRDDTRRYASILYAFVLSKFQSNSSAIDELLKIIPNGSQRFEQREASIITIGYVCSYRANSKDDLRISKEILFKLFDENQNSFLPSLLISFGQLARMRCFDENDKTSIDSIIEKFRAKLRTINETNRIKEKIIQTFGFISVCFRQRSQSIIDILTQSLVDSKQIELHLNIGDALICCILGVETPLIMDPYLVFDEKQRNDQLSCTDEEQFRYDQIKYLLERILVYSSDVNNPHTRQAATIWLLTFLIHCRRPYLQTTYRSLFEMNLFSLQTNLIYGLIDQDELNQELACKCLIYIYEIIDNEDLRTKFNNRLFEQFTDSTRSFSNQKTTLAYEHNIQSTSIENSQLNLYKELCGLVDLLTIDKNKKSQFFYSLLYLAHENSIWSTTRYGQMFGFQIYEEKSVELIMTIIEKIIARLYRLLFDPQIRVQESMKRIWNKLFFNVKQIVVVEKYFSTIFNELYQELLSSRWRVRESVQSAFLDIFRMLNRKLIDQRQYLELFKELFRRLMAVCDDTKESVRKIALQTMNSFKQNCILIACDPATTISNNMTEDEHQTRGRYVLEQILPILLNDGLYNKNEDIAKFSLNTIIEIIRYGDVQTLKPYCTIIIIALFEALSSVEPDIFNYASMKLTAAEMKEQIDMARLLCARSSPIMDAINTCTNQYVDEQILDDLSSKLIETIKHSVGLTTKCLIGQYFITLSHLYPTICSKYVGKWMAVLVNTMSTNSNRTLRKTYTNVLGTIVRIAKRSSIENLLQKITSWYHQTENDYQYVCALTLNSIAQFNQEMLTEHGPQILPLIFLAMQETKVNEKTDDQQQQELIWKNLWLEHTGSLSSGIQQYMNGILEQIRLAVEHSSYSMKIRGALAIRMIAETLKSNLKYQDLFVLVELIFKGLYGRTYDGKECFLQAMETICEHCRNELQSSSDLVQRIYDTIGKECKKDALIYRSMAIRVLGLLANDYSFEIYALFWTWFEKAFKLPEPVEGESIDQKIDADEDPVISDTYHRTLIECLPRFWPKTAEHERIHIRETVDILIELIQRSSWQRQIIIVHSINEILQRSSNISGLDLIRLFEPVTNLGPRSKASSLKREVLKFITTILTNDRYSICLIERENLRESLHFNIEEMIHDVRSSEISEQAKLLKKQHEHFFHKTQVQTEMKESTSADEQNQMNLF